MHVRSILEFIKKYNIWDHRWNYRLPALEIKGKKLKEFLWQRPTCSISAL